MSDKIRYSDNPPIVQFASIPIGGVNVAERVVDDYLLSLDNDFSTGLEAGDADRAKRRSGAKNIGNNIKASVAQCDEFWAYCIGVKPIGVMTLEFSNGYCELKYISTNPGAEGCGGALIEKAVERSVSKGFNGVVRLLATDDARPKYENMGFIYHGPSLTTDMSLTPMSSPHWSLSGSKFVLRKYASKKYATTF